MIIFRLHTLIMINRNMNRCCKLLEAKYDKIIDKALMPTGLEAYIISMLDNI